MIDINQIYDSLQPYIDQETISPDSDLNLDQGIDGDDFDEMIVQYQKKFKVDMSGYLWYFHSAEEGSWNSIGSLFSMPPYKRVAHIPVTPKMLLDFANKGRWEIVYPPHRLPRRRWDIIVNWVLLIIVLAWAFYSCFN